MIGARFGQYEVIAKLGEGGMGEVYRARDLGLNRDVALKILAPAFTGNAERVARFRREAQVLASINHPRIAHVYGLADARLTGSDSASATGGATLAFAMEPAHGGRLAAR